MVMNSLALESDWIKVNVRGQNAFAKASAESQDLFLTHVQILCTGNYNTAMILSGKKFKLLF